MALIVKALNNDTSFLLTFAPPITPANVQHPERFPGAFTVLIDPWLSGPAQMLHPKVSYQEHSSPACIESLEDLPEPDLILISQDKPDHCHEETLCQLSPHIRSTILAPAPAAKKIRGWGHFDFSIVHTLRRFKRNDPSTVFRVELPSFSPNGTPGEITVCLLEPKRDFAGVHNAVGITYRPPCSVLSLAVNSYVDLPQTPPASPPAAVQTPRTAPASTTRPPPFNYPHSPTSPSLLSPSPTFQPASPTALSPISLPPEPTRQPGTPSTPGSVRPRTPRVVSARANTIVPSPYASQRHEKTLSVLYSPHGVPYSLIQPWASSHLVALSALPLALLLHSFDRVTAPWYMGGTMAAGMPGGLEIAQALLPRAWVGAHDETKRASGVAMRGIVKRAFAADHIRDVLWGAVDKAHPRLGTHTDVLRLAAGQEWRAGFREVSQKERMRSEVRRKKEKEDREAGRVQEPPTAAQAAAATAAANAAAEAAA